MKLVEVTDVAFWCWISNQNLNLEHVACKIKCRPNKLISLNLHIFSVLLFFFLKNKMLIKSPKSTFGESWSFARNLRLWGTSQLCLFYLQLPFKRNNTNSEWFIYTVMEIDGSALHVPVCNHYRQSTAALAALQSAVFVWTAPTLSPEEFLLALQTSSHSQPWGERQRLPEVAARYSGETRRSCDGLRVEEIWWAYV